MNKRLSCYLILLLLNLFCLRSSAEITLESGWENPPSEARLRDEFQKRRGYDLVLWLPALARRLMVDLGDVREIAEVKVNGKNCGIVWCSPFQVVITDAVKLGGNTLEIGVVNFWPNRIIGDASQPKDRRLARTGIRKLTGKTPLMESGLLGPVHLMEQISPGN